MPSLWAARGRHAQSLSIAPTGSGRRLPRQFSECFLQATARPWQSRDWTTAEEPGVCCLLLHVDVNGVVGPCEIVHSTLRRTELQHYALPLSKVLSEGIRCKLFDFLLQASFAHFISHSYDGSMLSTVALIQTLTVSVGNTDDRTGMNLSFTCCTACFAMLVGPQLSTGIARVSHKEPAQQSRAEQKFLTTTTTNTTLPSHHGTKQDRL